MPIHMFQLEKGFKVKSISWFRGKRKKGKGNKGNRFVTQITCHSEGFVIGIIK